jgi:hypothetical protein
VREGLLVITRRLVSNSRGPEHQSLIGFLEHNDLSARVIPDIDDYDAENLGHLEVEENKIPSLPESSSSSVEPPRRKLVSWKDGDPENPYNWSSVSGKPLLLRKILIIFGREGKHG